MANQRLKLEDLVAPEHTLLLTIPFLHDGPVPRAER